MNYHRIITSCTIGHDCDIVGRPTIYRDQWCIRVSFNHGNRHGWTGYQVHVEAGTVAKIQLEAHLLPKVAYSYTGILNHPGRAMYVNHDRIKAGVTEMPDMVYNEIFAEVSMRLGD